MLFAATADRRRLSAAIAADLGLQPPSTPRRKQREAYYIAAITFSAILSEIDCCGQTEEDYVAEDKLRKIVHVFLKEKLLLAANAQFIREKDKMWNTGSYLIAGTLCHQFLFFTFWLSGFQDVMALQVPPGPSRISSMSMLASHPSSSIFEPIQISPSVIPHNPFPLESLPPMYPSFPTTYIPVLTGRCPVNFSAISSIMDKTASDCSQPLAALVGNVVCCPQFSSFLHIFQGYYSLSSDNLVLQNAVADDCFKDIINILGSRGANSSIPTICSVKSSNLTGGSCPVKDIMTFERKVNTSKLLEACSTVDPLKECCRPVCQPAIKDAALQISVSQLLMSDNRNTVGQPTNIDVLNDCKGVVYSWISRKLSSDAANTAFRILSACKVNKVPTDIKEASSQKLVTMVLRITYGLNNAVCPLDFKQPSEVINACRNVAAPSPSCCSSLNTYIAGIQKQMLITNRQAINCAIVFGSMLQKGGVITDIYELCDVDLKDFSLQAAYGQQGCLLRSLPADVVFDNSTGFSFTCDLSDNIAAPWPSSPSISSLSLCAPEMSLPALPTSETLGNPGSRGAGLDHLIPVLLFFVISTFLYGDM
ncbi:hypothetical protein RJ640_013429 [Escallonia rubra]|uniref:SPARK domain-containing protein n=1 Tax=Escallonia rubra TaxID=112253 RepID=A0AA88QK19_9ASTE|nr:hypothetical protein RJ640_013429 [Escallonia rubra]